MPWRPRHTSAQRLSASKRISHRVVNHPPPASRVLNAFRHQRGFHPVATLAGSSARSCAQRLSASEEGSGYCLNLCNPSSDGAQRLSASKRISHRYWCCLFLASACSTPFGIKEDFTGGELIFHRGKLIVLNAFRHQRGFHPVATLAGSSARSCAQRLSASKRISRGHDDIHVHRREVLNAFRHQRGFHEKITFFWQGGRFKCSTPFGIKEDFTVGR